MKTVALLAIAGIAAAATADFSVSGAGPTASNGPVGNAANGVFTFTATQSGTFSGIRIQGTLASTGAGSWSSEARYRLTADGGVNRDTSTGLTGTAGTTFTSLNIDSTNTFTSFSLTNGNSYSIRFWESFDDGGTSAVDANWSNYTFTFSSPPPPPPPSFLEDLGDNSTWGNVINRAGSITAGQTKWYKFSVASPQAFTDIWTAGSNFDTEIAVYGVDGNVVATNDDYTGGNLRSRLGFGAGSQLTVWDSGTSAVLGATSPGTATATQLAAGTYYLAIAGFNSAFNSAFSVTGGTAVGDYSLSLIPTPGSLALLGLGGLAAARRRR